MSGVLVSVTQNGRETGTAMNAGFFFIFTDQETEQQVHPTTDMH